MTGPGERTQRDQPVARPPDEALELERLRSRVEQYAQLLALMPETGAPVEDALVARPAIDPTEAAGAIARAGQIGMPQQDIAGWPGIARPHYALTPPTGFGAQSLGAMTVPTLAVKVFGLAGEPLETVVAMIARRQQQSRDFRPVFLTDSADLGPFRRHGFACEHFPPALYGPADRPARFARRARLAALQRKWAFAGTLDLGAAAERPRSAWSAAEAGDGQPSPMPDTASAIAMIRESGLFDEDWYLATYPDAAGSDPVRHYLETGAARGYDPSPLFRTTFYVRQLMRMGAPKPD
ncbi:MAG: hypothetical protein KIS96_06960 [Bauldia sp.]|nr:hypothetical protein [Bauldia sp.]